MTTLVDAAVKPNGRPPTSPRIAERLRSAGRRRPFCDHEEQRRRGCRRPRSCTQPITTVLSGPAAGALGAAPARPERRRSTGCSPSTAAAPRTDVARRARRRAHPDHRGLGRRLPEPDPDDRRRDRRRRRRLGRLGLAGGHAQGRARARPAPTPARSATARAAPSRPSPTPTCVLGRIPPHLLGGGIPLDVDAARGGPRAAGRQARAGSGGAAPRHPGDLAPGTRRTRCGRSPSSAGSTSATSPSTTFGGSGSLLACRLVDVLGLAGVAGAARPGQRVGVRAAHRRRPDRPRAHRRAAGTTGSTSTAWPRRVRRARAPRPRTALAAEGFPRDRARARAHRRPAVRRAGVRGAGAGAGRRPSTPRSRRRGRRVPRRARAAVRLRLRAAEPDQAVEWVNLRVTGVGPIRRPGPAPTHRGRRRRRRRAPAPAPRTSYFERAGWTTSRSTGAPSCGPATSSTGPAVIEEFGSTVPLHPGFTRAASTAYAQPARHLGARCAG